MNWLIFQDSSKSEFGELICAGHSLYRRNGKLFTFGTSERTNYENDKALADAFSEQRTTFLNTGMNIVREWEFDPAFFDFTLFQTELTNATRRAVAELRSQHPNLNGFALGTDHDAMTIGLICHEFEGIEDASDDTLLNPAEWSIWDNSPHFDPAYRLILSQHRDDLTKVDYVAYKAGFKRSCIATLRTLDSEGIFGKRDSRILMYDVSDSEQDAEIIEQLNVPEIYKRWQAWA